jgi:hypothetical protein
VTVVEDQHVVEDGDVLTSAGNWATGRASGGSGSRKDSRI